MKSVFSLMYVETASKTLVPAMVGYYNSGEDEKPERLNALREAVRRNVMCGEQAAVAKTRQALFSDSVYLVNGAIAIIWRTLNDEDSLRLLDLEDVEIPKLEVFDTTIRALEKDWQTR